MLIAILYLILYVVIAVLVVELVLWIIGTFFTNVPPRIRQLLYAIVAVLFVIWLIRLLVGYPGHPLL